MIRLAFKTPIDFNRWTIYNQAQKKSIVVYRFNVSPETISEAIEAGLDLASNPSLADVLKLVGSYSVLWIGPNKGTVAPMDAQPQGWTWDVEGEKPIPAELFWQWIPDGQSDSSLTSEANSFAKNPESVSSKSGVFKQLVSFNFQQKYGTVESIEGINIQRLPDLVRKDTDWIFEFSIPEIRGCGASG